MPSSPGAGRGRHLVLLGPPGAGKSTVGPLVADALGRPFVDLDAEIARRAGRSVAEIFAAARAKGSEVHDAIEPAPGRPRTGNVQRRTNRAGGLEGGMTTGEPLVLRVAMKPIATLMRPLGTVDIPSGDAAVAVAERSDVTAVPAMGVIAEAMLAFVLAQAWMEKFGGDSLGETRRNVDGYLSRVAMRVGSGRLAQRPDGRDLAPDDARRD